MTALKRQHGFTLIEALVGMALAAIVFGATLTVLEVYMRQSNGVTQRFDAQNQARVAVDRIVRQLRNVASPLTSPKLLERATPYDIVFQTIGPSTSTNPSGTERVRYCVPPDTASGSSANWELVSQVQTVATSSNDPWSSDPSVTVACPDTTFTPSVSTDPTYTVIAQNVINRYKQTTSRHLFSYNNGGITSTDLIPSANLSDISTIQVNLWVNPTPTVSGATTEIQSSAYLRNKQHAPVAQFNYTATGGGSVVLNAGTSYSPDGEQLSYSWTCTSCSSGNSLTGQNSGLVTWSPGAGTYSVDVTATDESGLSTTSSVQTVTVT
jgi:prepilin-type N-terminal cleavage/methylation domain-containing protein